jgi:hypothetical protein
MFRIVAEKPSSIEEAQANQLVDQWLATYTPWADDPTPHEITLVNDPITDAPQHFRGDLRFERDSDMITIREQIETDLAGVTSWYRVAYHKCSHDESEATACSWDSVTDYGDVPNGILRFE